MLKNFKGLKGELKKIFISGVTWRNQGRLIELISNLVGQSL
jgi:hypothetical protein